jgi:hypothetical protein
LYCTFPSESFKAPSYNQVEASSYSQVISSLGERMQKYLSLFHSLGTKSPFFILGTKRVIVFLMSNCRRDSLGAHCGYRAVFQGSCVPGSHLTPHPASVATNAPILHLCIPNLLFTLSPLLSFPSFFHRHGFQPAAITRIHRGHQPCWRLGGGAPSTGAAEDRGA